MGRGVVVREVISCVGTTGPRLTTGTGTVRHYHEGLLLVSLLRNYSELFRRDLDTVFGSGNVRLEDVVYTIHGTVLSTG